MNDVTVQLIEIEWKGPYTPENIKLEFNNKKTDYGLYCIYGNHAISGPETLLYIGKANEQTFATRFKQHHAWIALESNDVTIFIGRIGSTKHYNDEGWTKNIDDAEALLIHYLSPPYNTSCIYEHPFVGHMLINNLHKRYRLPYTITSGYYHSSYYKPKEGAQWKPYEYNGEDTLHSTAEASEVNTDAD